MYISDVILPLDHLSLDSAPNLGLLIQYFVGKSTSSKVADTKVSGF